MRQLTDAPQPQDRRAQAGAQAGRRWLLVLVLPLLLVVGLAHTPLAMGLWQAIHPGMPGMPIPAYMFVWRAVPPPTMSAQQAFATAARVQRTRNSAEVSPADVRWIAQSSDAALLVAQLDPSGAWVSVVTLTRVASGPHAGWQGGDSTLPSHWHCAPSTATVAGLPLTGMCGQSIGHTSGSVMPVGWDWSAPDGTIGFASRFASPLPQPLPSGASIAGLTLAIATVTLPDGGAVVAAGTADAATVQQLAQRLAATV